MSRSAAVGTVLLTFVIVGEGDNVMTKLSRSHTLLFHTKRGRYMDDYNIIIISECHCLNFS